METLGKRVPRTDIDIFTSHIDRCEKIPYLWIQCLLALIGLVFTAGFILWFVSVFDGSNFSINNVEKFIFFVGFLIVGLLDLYFWKSQLHVVSSTGHIGFFIL